MIPPIRFIASAVWSDAQLVSTEVQLGTGATAVANSTTTSVILPKPACTSCQLVSLSISAQVAALSASGTVLLQVFKRDNTGTPADRTLTAATSIEADFLTLVPGSYTIPITATSIQNVTFKVNDLARIDAVANNTIGTAPVVTVSATWAIIQP